jgi:DNA-binding GntR family transcriptional regulator
MATVAPPPHVATPRRERIVDEVLDLALDGRLKPGTPTSEQQIAAMLPDKPSRTPVREALALLVRDGIFDQFPQRGVQLRPPAPEEISELMALRRPLETLIVKRLALNSVSQDLSPLEIACEEAAHAIRTHSMKDYTRADLHFHCALAQSARMRAAEVSLRSWISRLRLFAVGQPLDVEAAEHDLRIQGRVIDAIRHHDPIAAERQILESLASAETRLVEGLPMAIVSTGEALATSP